MPNRDDMDFGGLRRDLERKRANARDNLFNGPSAPVINLGMAEAECRKALQEFSRDLPSFCKQLDIAPAILNLRTPELLMIVCMRQQALIDTLRGDLDELRRVAVTKED